MAMSQTNRRFILFIILLTVVLLSACSTTPIDKNQQIIAVIKNMESAIEEKRVDDFMASLDDAINAENSWQKNDIERFIRLRLLRPSNVHIHSQLKQLTWQDDSNEQAQAVVMVAMAGTTFNLTDLARINADLMRFSVTFQAHDDSYVVSQVDWQRAQAMEFL